MIQTTNLTKTFGPFMAVDHLNLKILPGETYGFLGPNGAGKTTTLLMILGILKPTEGEVHVFGEPVSSGSFSIKRRLGVVAEYQSFYDEMTAWEYLMFFSKLFEVEDPEKRIQELMGRIQLWKWRNVLLSGYSTGMKRKLGFVRALLHSPDVLILDEPVSGLDPFGVVQIREVLIDEHKAGKTILISSHILSEVERTADRVGIIAQGRLLVEDSMVNLRQKVGGCRRIELQALHPTEKLVQEIHALPFVDRIDRENDLMVIYTHDDADYRADLGRFLTSQGVVVQGMRALETTLEEAFITITEAHIRDWTGSQDGD